MSFVQALVLGAVQGLTEFVPISSSGHLVLVPESLGWAPPGLAFDVLLHTASLVALVAYFWNDLVGLARGLKERDSKSTRLTLLLGVGTIPAALAGVILADYFEASFEDAHAAAVQLGITGVILVAAELVLAWHARQARAAGAKLRSMDDLNWSDAIIVGIAQAISILPGISRSGATIAAGLCLRVARDDAARFGFLLSIPALLGAAIVKLPDLGEVTLDAGVALGGFISSLVLSYVAIAGLIRYLRTRNLYPFAIYCFVGAFVFYVLV